MSFKKSLATIAIAATALVSFTGCAELDLDNVIENSDSSTSQSVTGEKYDRDKHFGDWADLDNDGCTTRNEILQRDLTDVTLDTDGCKVETGVLDDPYTGETINFKAGRGTSSDVQIDHVIALKDAWERGADQWDQETRIAFANDPMNLKAVDGSENQSKGAQTPTEWIPSDSSYTCEYVTDYVAVGDAYNLDMTDVRNAYSADCGI